MPHNIYKINNVTCSEYDVEIRQEPKRAKISIINERGTIHILKEKKRKSLTFLLSNKDRRPIEPPPILQLHWKNCTEEELK